MTDLLKNFSDQQRTIDTALEDKKKSLDADRALLEPIVVKDETGEMTEEEEKEMLRL